MANRYWVGGTAAWNGTIGTKWSLTSGGVGGQADPTSADDVFLDANSGANTVTVSGSRVCKSLTCTGFTGTLTGASTPFLSVYGTVLLVSGMSAVGAMDILLWASGNFTSAGRLLANAVNVTLETPGATTTALDAFAIGGTLTVTAGTFAANGQNVTCAAMSSSGGTTRAISMGSGTWTLTGTGSVWDAGTSGITITPSTSTVKITDASVLSKTFVGGSYTYGNIWLTGAGTGTFIVTGSNTFADFKVDTPPHTVQFESGSTQTLTSFTVSGSAVDGLMTLEPTGAAHWNLTCIAGASRSYLALRGSHAHGGDFIAANSFDAGDNFNWDFVRSSSTDIYLDSAYQYNGSATATISGLNWLIGETLGVVADGVDIGDAVVSSAGNLTLPSSLTGSVVTVGKRYLSRAVTLRAPQTGNADGASIGRQMNVKKAAADILNTPYLKVGTQTGTEIIPPSWRGGVTGDGQTGLFGIPVDDSHFNEGVIIFETDKGYPAMVRGVRFEIESEP